MRALGLGVIVACFAIAPPAWGAANGTIVITGTETRDEVRVGLDGESLVVTPAVGLAITDSNGQARACAVETDPLVGRPLGHRCGKLPQITRYDLSVDLRGGSDTLTVERNDAVAATTALGGAGDDVMQVEMPGPRTLRGGDGDDVLKAPAENPNPVVFDGGAGRDLVDYAGVRAFEGRTPGGVRASLTAGSATVIVGRATSNLPEQTRTDSLVGIERLSGTPQGDILTGSAGDDELQGAGGPDNLFGLDGNDLLGGGDGEDLLDGAKGADTMDGGARLDEFKEGFGGDTLLTRDGVAEKLVCVSADVVVDDLVDQLRSPEKCFSVSTAQAKHAFDTTLPRRILRVGSRGRVRVPVACPARKTERCQGLLFLRRGSRGRVLDRARYSIAPGRRARVRLRVGARRRAVTLEAIELDADGRPRSVLGRARLRLAGEAARPR
jgi:hypothetical protein